MSDGLSTANSIEVRGSRQKAALLLIGCLGAMGVGWLLTRSTETPTRPAGWHHLVGWLNIALFGGCGLVGIEMLIRPRRLIIESDSFTAKILWQTKRYFYEDIDEIWVRYTGAAASVVWTSKKNAGGLGRTMWGFDRSLPGGWAITPEELAAELRSAKERYDAEKPEQQLFRSTSLTH
jgi:hypothetical protein